MSHIDDKHKQLRNSGLDLGAALGPEEDAGFGGRVRKYERGHIYWHKSTGAHEVHGGILDIYLKHGGPGFNDTSGERHFGFPKGDEETHPSFGYPTSRFEFGQIYWAPDTRGCAVFGSIYDPRRETLGSPVTGNVETASALMCFYERGIRFRPKNPAGNNPLIDGTYEPPLMGNPQIMNHTDPAERTIRMQVKFMGIERAKFNAISQWNPNIWSQVLSRRFALAPCDSPFSFIEIEPNQHRITSESVGHLDIGVTFTLPETHPVIHNRMLYDLVVHMPNGMPYPLSPHCLYLKDSWDNFGLFHITDLHICRRNEEFRNKLAATGHGDAASEYANFQDALRNFIHYANRLHRMGIADAVVATGDLVDYVHEDRDNKTVGNFGRLRRLLLGLPIEGNAPASEELKIPIFMTFGNHDYRLNPYDLRANVDLPGSSKDTAINEHSTHNITEEEAIALQDGKTPKYGLTSIEGAGRPLEIDRFDNKYVFFKKYMARNLSYVVKLGKHRLVMMDTKSDNGVPEDFDLMTLLNVAGGGDGFFSGQLGGGLPATKKLLAGGGPDSVGFGPPELNMLRSAVADSDPEGLVIVGMHCPAFSPEGGEYAYFMRETIFPHIDGSLMTAYLDRHEIQERSTWAGGGVNFFKVANAENGMDRSVIAHGRQEFIEICAGKGMPRPVDLVLYGHKHDRVEYRVKVNDANGELQFFTDFYTENPARYYHSQHSIESSQLPNKAALQIHIKDGAPVTGNLSVVRDHSDGPTKVFGKLELPPYATPLNSQKETKQWWLDHRPLFAQTGALGPIDPRQRFAKFFKMTPPIPHYRPVVEMREAPEINLPSGPFGSFPSNITFEEVPRPVPQPTFQGFRFIRVRDNVIARIHYIVMSELRANNFRMPWEREFSKFGHLLDIGAMSDHILVDASGISSGEPGPIPGLGTVISTGIELERRDD